MQENSQTNPKCKRCGKCCYYQKGDTWVPCKYLKQTKNHRAYCSIYQRRIGVKIAPGLFCTFRINQHLKIPGCPYNKKHWAKHPFWTNQKSL
jgi:uncharacterized cysteine cluster protein YcgN (CxxCxxCC family)